MIFALWLLAPAGLLLAVGLGLSFYMTRRHHLTEIHSPAEYGLDFEDIAFQAADGLMLRGWFIPAPDSDRAILILHGHGGSMDYDVFRARYLHAAGFNVMLFDFRAHGRSEGRKATFGYLERRDVLGAVQFLKSRAARRIGLLGFSYGGIAATLSAPICPDIAAIITDGVPARIRTAIAAYCVEIGLPRWLSPFVAWLTISMTSLRFGTNLFQYEPVRWVGKIAPRPIFFIHGDLDQYCPDFDDLYIAANEPKEVWRLSGVGHTKASETYPEEFRRRVIGFFDKNL